MRTQTMTDRDRLIWLLQEYSDNNNGGGSNHGRADYLIENGVIVLPCKVGDIVYVPWTWDSQQGVSFAEVEEIKIYDNKNHIMFFIDLESDDEEFEQQYGGWKLDKSIGKTVFLTREEAEAELEKRSEEND